MDQPPKIANRSTSQTTVGLLAIGGLIAAAYLSSITIQAEFGYTVSGLLCGINDFLDCDSAARSSFAKILGIPIAVLGVAFYTAIAAIVTLTTVNHNYSHPFSAPALAQTLFGFGSLYSVFLFIISVTQFGSLCPFCAILYVINILGFVAAGMWSGQKAHVTFLNQLRNLSSIFKIWAPPVFAVVFVMALLASMSIRQFSIDKRTAEYARMEAGKSSTKPLDDSRFRASHSPGIGPLDAPVVIVEFSSFTCPHCASFSETLKKVVDKYPKQVRVEFRHFPLPHEISTIAAKAGVCAHEQRKFWPLHDKMFGNPQALSESIILGYAAELGLDADQLQACMKSELARKIVELDVSAAKKLNIVGAPTFFLNGQIFEGALGYESLERRIEGELK